MSGHQKPAFHEVDMFLHFTDYGLDPYWAVAGLCINEFDGYTELDMELADGPWHVQLNYSKSGIAPRPSDDVAGDVLYEFDLHLGGPGEKKAHFNISPRFDDMRKLDGEKASVGWRGGEGVDVHVQGANVTYDEYVYLLQRALQEVADTAGTDFNRRYFGRPLGSSNIVTTELYVRLMREYAKKLVRTTGVFFKLMHLLADEKGTEWVYSADNTDIVGKRHAFELDPQCASKLGPGQSLGRTLKCYHPKHVRSKETEDDPLSSPKFGVAFHRSKNDGETVSWRDRDSLLQEIEESLLNVLRWAGIPTDPDPTVFVEDDHFEIEGSDRSIALLDDPTPRLEANQENLVRTVLSDMTPSSEAVLETLATDGGKRYDELAEETDYSISQIYRAIDQLGDVVVNKAGHVKLFSEKIRQEVETIVDEFDQKIDSTAKRLARIANVESRSAADSALQLWMNKYGASIEEIDGEGKIRFDTVLSDYMGDSNPTLEDVLQEGLDAWTSGGRDPVAFVRMRFEAEEIVGRRRRDGKVARFVSW